jgi:hypothetical protein
VAPASSVGAVIAAILPVLDSAPGRGREVCRRGSIHESAEKRGWECAALGPSETHFAWGSYGLRCIVNLRNRHLAALERFVPSAMALRNSANQMQRLSG